MHDFSVEVINLKKSFKDKRKGTIKAIDDISFKVKKGTIHGFLGPNGAGKTTTIKTICGLVKPDSGTILIDDQDIAQSREKVMEKLGLVFEGNRNLYWKLSVKENLEFFLALKGKNPKKHRDRIDYLLEYFSLVEKRYAEARTLSRGMQQKLAIAASLVSDTNLVILDEPTLGLDVESCIDIKGLIKDIVEKENKTVLLTTHDMDVVDELCENVTIISNGKIICDDKKENMFKVFGAKRYKVILNDKLSDTQKECLKKFEMMEIVEDVNNTAIEVEILNGNKFYEIVDILKMNQSEIESIYKEQIDFEKVFLNLVQMGGYKVENKSDFAS